MSFNKFLDFFGLGDSNNFSMNENKREKQEKQQNVFQKQILNSQKPLRLMMLERNQNKMKNILQEKIIEVPEQLQYEVKQFKKQRNWYIFPKDQPQKYKTCEKCLPYCDSVETKFIFVTDYERFLPNSSHLKFTQLTNIILIQCNIGNIEALSWLNSPQLRNIYLDKNNIISIKPILKTKFSLSVLSFIENPIQDFDLSRFHIKKNSIGNNFSLFVSNLFKIQSLSFIKLMKIQTKHLSFAVKESDINNEFYFQREAFSKMEDKMVTLAMNPEGIRQLVDFQESKSEYMYMQKVQKRKGNMFVIQEP